MKIGEGMFIGSCLCKSVEFQAVEKPGLVFNCHCSRCRKSSGAAFATQVFAQRSTLNFTKGKELITEYESTGGMRIFCSKCGSRLMNYGKGDVDYLSVAISAIDTPVDIKPSADCFISNKYSWTSIDENIVQHNELPEKL